jgi:TP901 family phage tail tape measure protein
MAGINAVKSGFGMIKQGAAEIGSGFLTMYTGGGGVLASLGMGVANVGRGFLLLGGVVAAIGAAIAIYLGVQAVRAAGDFQQGLGRLVTGAGDVTDNMGKMGTAILGISTSTGVLTGQLLPAMYQIISANQRGTQAEDTLRVAAMGSVAEQAKIVDVAKAITTAMTDYGTKQYNATQFMNGYTRATQLGKVTLEQLSNSMGPILPLAKNIGISFADVAGAMATMTNAGIPANVAATSLRFLMQSLENPTLKARNAMDAMGLSSVAVGNEMKVSLPGALDMIYKAALRAGPEGSVPFNRAMSDMVGGQRSLQAMLSLTGSHFGTFSADSRAVAAAMNFSKTAVLGWDTAQSNFNVKMDMARAAVAALGIIIGSQLLPFLSQIVGMVLPLISSFTQWVVQSHVVENAMHTLVSALQSLVAIGASVVAFFKNNELAMSALKGVLITVAAIIAIALVAALLSAASAAWTFAAGMIAAMLPLYLVIAAVALLVAAFIHFYTTSAGFRAVVDAIVGALKQAWAVILQVAAVLMGGIGPAIAWVVTAWHNLVAAMAPAIAFLSYVGSVIAAALMPILRQLWAFIVADFVPVWQQLVATWRSQFLPLLAQVWSAIQQFTPVLRLLGIALLVVAGIIVGVVVVALVLLLAVFAGLARGLAGMLSGLVTAFQGIVQIVTGALQVLGGIIGFFTDLVTGKFDKLGADLGMIWQGIINIFVGAWTLIAGVFNAAIFLIIGLVSGFVDAIIAFFTSLAQAIVGGSIVPDMCNAIIAAFTGMIASVLSLISGFISSAIALFVSLGAQAIAAITNAANQVIAAFNNMTSQAIGACQSLVSGAAGILNQLAGIAANAGSAMISALVGQINAGVGWVAGAVNNVVSTIRNLLPGSPAKEGPLRDLPKFGPAITGGLASGIRSGIPEVRAAAMSMVEPIGGQMAGQVSSPGVRGASQSTSSDNRPLIIQVGNAQYQAFIRNLGRDMATQIYIQGGGKL